MSLPDNQLEPLDRWRDDNFTCHLCGDVKPIDDVSREARAEWSEPVCYQCWERVST